jgi:1-acyl-sn-glycerol-3-phosphate acyltransferase
MRALADRVVRTIARLAILGWFRGVEVAGMDRVGSGPTIVVANHPGGFVDPALLSAVLPRVPRFLALASLWRIWPLRPLLSLAGAIPVRRAKDGATDRNADAFAVARQRLADDGLVAIFPEGQASDEPHLLPVKTGAARIALGAATSGTRGITLVPVGLIYERKQTARARAYVRVGEPVDLDRELAARGATPDPDDRPLVGAITEAIEERLADAALDFEDAAQASDLTYAAIVSLRRDGGNPSWTPPLSAVDEVAGRLAEAPAAAQARVRTAVVAYREALATNQVSDRQVAAGPGGLRRTARALGGSLGVLAVPFAVVGLVVNAVPAAGVWLAGRRPAAPVTLATTKFLVGLVLFPATWLVWRYVAFDAATHPWLRTIALGPVCGLIAALLGYRLHLARLARLRPSRLVLPSTAAQDLAERRADVLAAVRAALDDGRGGVVAGSLAVRP